jgi:hypothetical protein
MECRNTGTRRSTAPERCRHPVDRGRRSRSDGQFRTYVAWTADCCLQIREAGVLEKIVEIVFVTGFLITIAVTVVQAIMIGREARHGGPRSA